MRDSSTYFYVVARIRYLMTLPTIMKNPLLFFNRMALTVCCAILMLSCGDAGIGFNVSTEVPVTVPVTIEVPTVPSEIADLLDINPPSEQFDYNLNEVGAFDDALGDLGGQDNIIVNELSYQIENISSSEEVPLDELTISITVGGAPLEIFRQTNTLANQSKTTIALTEDQRTSIVNELFNSDRIDAVVVFDLSDIPDSGEDIVFDFTLYFDVTLKARDL